MRLTTRDYDFKVKEMTDAGIFTGYGSVFGVIDSYKEVVAPGAFAKSLAKHRERGTMPAMLWQHRSDQPVGAYSLVEEDGIGLKTVGTLAIKTQAGSEARELMKMKAVTGLSIGFVPRKESFDKSTGITTLEEIDLWEISLVTFPANDAARVQGVKSIEVIEDLKSAEQYLRDLGLSRREALAFVSKVKSLNQSDSDADNDAKVKSTIERLLSAN